MNRAEVVNMNEDRLDLTWLRQMEDQLHCCVCRVQISSLLPLSAKEIVGKSFVTGICCSANCLEMWYDKFFDSLYRKGDAEAQLYVHTIVDIARDFLDPIDVTDKPWVWAKLPYIPKPGTNFGKWCVFKPHMQLDEVWHTVRSAIEGGEFGSGCTGGKCSTGFKSSFSNGVVIVYTTKEKIDEVGLLLILKVRQSIVYKTNEVTFKGLYAHKGNRNIAFKSMHWRNNGDIVFEHK